MVKFIETEAASIDAAVSIALEQLKMDRDSVTVEVLEKGKNGFFGLGAIPARVRVSYEESPALTAKEFVDGILEKMGINGEAFIDKNSEEDHIRLDIRGEDMGAVIGRRGDTLDAIQYLTSLSVNRDLEEHVRVSIDTENYRQKREESLERLARKIAGKVMKYKKNMTLEPMNPYERRIIHAALQDYKGITTYSTGSEPNRRVVVAIAGRGGAGKSSASFEKNSYSHAGRQQQTQDGE